MLRHRNCGIQLAGKVRNSSKAHARNKAKGKQPTSGRSQKRLHDEADADLKVELQTNNLEIDGNEETEKKNSFAKVSRLLDFADCYDEKKFCEKKKSSYLFGEMQARKKKYKKWANPKVVIFQNDKGFTNQYADQ